MHVDADLLGLLALGERAGTDDDMSHVHTCPDCTDELSQLERLVTLGREVGADTTLLVPSEGVWLQILAELGAEHEPNAPVDELPDELSQPDEHVVAHARLAPVDPAWNHASGRAELNTDEDGRLLLRVLLRAELENSGVRQAWLVHRDNPHLRQTLGVLDGPHGLWTVPHSIDLNDFAILDISQQQTGETEHSGRTIVRGEFALIS